MAFKRIGLCLAGLVYLGFVSYSESIGAAASVLDQDAIELFNRYLATPEYLFAKKLYSDQTKSIYRGALPFKYPPSVISSSDYEEILNRFLATYSSFPKTPYVHKTFLPVGAEVRFFGDLHGSIHALIRMLCRLMVDGFVDEKLRIIQPKGYLVFLGDFIDYGRNGADTLALVMMLRIKNPTQVLVCRGNHEDNMLYIHPDYGFQKELEARYSGDASGLKTKIDAMFAGLPMAIFLGIDKQAAAGFVQCCHGGLAADSDTQSSITKLLAADKPNNATEPVPIPTQDTPSNLQWGDFTGETLFGGSKAVIRRGTQFDIDGAKAELGKFNTKFVFRGHQDACYACKNLVRGIQDPICLIPLEKKNQEIIEAVDAGSGWIAKNASSLDQLRDTGFLLGELPDFIGPVFTFTNASAARANYDEGFGLLSVGTSWEKSRLKFYISRPEILSVRAALYSPTDMAALIPREIPVLKATDLAPALLLPHYTHIDGSGNATIYIRKPATLSYTTHIFEKCLARYGAPSGFSEGVSADFIPNISQYFGQI